MSTDLPRHIVEAPPCGGCGLVPTLNTQMGLATVRVPAESKNGGTGRWGTTPSMVTANLTRVGGHRRTWFWTCPVPECGTALSLCKD